MCNVTVLCFCSSAVACENVKAYNALSLDFKKHNTSYLLQYYTEIRVCRLLHRVHISVICIYLRVILITFVAADLQSNCFCYTYEGKTCYYSRYSASR